MTTRLSLLTLIATIAVISAPACGGAAPAESPLTYLFDTAAPAAAALEPAALQARRDWQVMPEDELKHEFRGDAVLLNDKLIVVLRRQGHAAEIYARTTGGPKLRASVAPGAEPASSSAVRQAEGSPQVMLSAIRILENGPSAVGVEAVFRAGPTSSALRYRLTTGQGLLELQPGENARRIFAQSPAQYALVPDFFGDDMVVTPSTAATPASRQSRSERLGLPAENFFLTLADQGRSMLMCVWATPGTRAELLKSGAQDIAAFEILCTARNDRSIWLALIEGTDLWHAQLLGTEALTTLAWKAPFPAKWRADLTPATGIASSHYFRTPGASSGDHEVAGGCTCHLEPERAVVEQLSGKPPVGGPEKVLIYAIDRTPATPLTTICPIDVLRNTLGVGPCQYILQTEGLGTDASPTPDSVMTWIEKQIERKRQRKAADEIRQLLTEMTEHVAHAQKRIEHYALAIRDLRALLPSSANAAADPAMPNLLRTVVYLEKVVEITNPPAPARAAELADQIAARMRGADPAAECRPLGNELRGVGTRQDRTLANCRMGLRWLKEQTRAIAAEQPQHKGWIDKIQSRIGQALSTPHAPREGK